MLMTCVSIFFFPCYSLSFSLRVRKILKVSKYKSKVSNLKSKLSKLKSKL